MMLQQKHKTAQYQAHECPPEFWAAFLPTCSLYSPSVPAMTTLSIGHEASPPTKICLISTQSLTEEED